MTSSALIPLPPRPGGTPEDGELDRAVLDLWEAHVAVLRPDGTIEAVNAAWERLAVENGGGRDTTGVGVNYLEVAARAAGEDPALSPVVEGLRRVLLGRDEEYTREDACHSPIQRRWFRLRARRVLTAGQARVVVAHDDVSESRRP